MFVGVCRLTFHLHGVASLKAKRQVMRRIIERTRSKFNVSAAEVSDNDVHRRAVVGVSVVGNSRAHVDGMLSTIIRFVDKLGVAPVSGVETEVIALRDLGDGISRPIEDWQTNWMDDTASVDDMDEEEEEDLW